ncbi:MAG: ferritin-like domain-containing protein [Devosia sp.]|jgi:ferritin-like metal-binding protein YciE|uniref:ferritin-like domain-containing protein n=1 Tax=unclassified Devosia TaxID=196773 RepID=UPI0019DC0D0A|nr:MULTISPECIES: ferritin-like domain-containing protein [unclassified Devosia]MBF0680125.1 ferritin-like domain-containing protein [Devosia sp.]WEJ35001.1 ferritin-like domain-containing protein [Devosia sp. SD17-2]
MTVTAQDLFITGLKNAHAMENQALSILKPQAERIENYPEIEAKIRDHIAETEGQIGRLERVLDTLGEDKSTLKDLALSLAGTMASVGHTVAPDEILKNSMANFAFENFEIAAYKSLITLAEASGNGAAMSELEAILHEEMAMAEWLYDNIEMVTLKFASLKEAGETAKK